MENVNIAGEWRRPVNTSANQKGGIHDDETASGLGFKGGTVAGSIHMEQFPPLLVSHFGDAWWRTGGLSLYFETATTDGQPVQCHLEAVSDNRARVWMENEAGDRIMAGTASLGEDPESTVKGRVTAA